MHGRLEHDPPAHTIDNPQVHPYSSACRKGRLKFLHAPRQELEASLIRQNARDRHMKMALGVDSPLSLESMS
jgi:hypothetical protein